MPQEETQQNRERIIKLEAVMERIEQRLDEIVLSQKAILKKFEDGEVANRTYFATKSEFQELKKAHNSLVSRISQVVMFVLLAVVGAVLAAIGLDKI